MKKNFLFGILAILLTGFWFGGISLACEEWDVAKVWETCYNNITNAIKWITGEYDTVELLKDITTTLYLWWSNTNKLEILKIKKNNYSVLVRPNPADNFLSETVEDGITTYKLIACTSSDIAWLWETCYSDFDTAANARLNDDEIVWLLRNASYTMKSSTEILKIKIKWWSLHVSAPYWNYYVANTTDSYGVTTYDVRDIPEGAVASVWDTTYTTLADAITVAWASKIITLLTDIPSYEMDTINTVKIDKNNHNITITAPEGFVIGFKNANWVTTYTKYNTSLYIVELTELNGDLSYLKNLSSISSNWTYKLLNNISSTSRIVPGVLLNNVTIDLNWYTLTSTASDAAIWFGRDWTESKHKINSIIDTSTSKWWKIIATWLNPSESSDALISIFGTYNDITIWEWVILEGWAITIFGNNNTLDFYWTVNWWDDFGVATNGADTTNAVINIHEWAEISSNQTAIYLPWKTNLTATIDGIVVWWKTAVEIRAGTLTIWEGAVLTSNWEFEAPAANWNGTTMNWVALAISQHTTNLPISVTINWWTFSWSKAVYEEDLQDEVATDDISISVSSGNFNWDVYSENVSGFINWWVFSPVAPSAAYIEDGYYAKEIDDDKYEITEIQEITSIDITWITTPVAWTTRTLDWIEITTTPGDAITIESEEWTVYPADNSSAYPMATGETFNTEDSYSFSIVYRLKTGYKLSNTTTYPENSQHDIQAGENPGYYIVIPYDDVTSWYTVTWKNWNNVLEIDENVAHWSQPSYDSAEPTKAATSSYTYTFSWWSKDGTNVVNLASETITENTTYLAVFTSKKKSSWGGGGGGWSNWWSTTTTNTNTNTWNITNTNTWNITNTNTWDTNNATEENKNSEENKNLENSLPEVVNYNPNLPGDKQILADGLTPELHYAYNFAFENGITTKPTIQEAEMNSPLTRIAMAKMLSQYAINILGKAPDTTKTISFPDVSAELDTQYNNWVTLAYQLWIMGIWIDEFRPFDIVIRAEFVTALSRMLYWLADGEWLYYETHMQKLLNEKIITVADPNMNELRGYVMIMLMRSSENE